MKGPLGAVLTSGPAAVALALALLQAAVLLQTAHRHSGATPSRAQTKAPLPPAKQEERRSPPSPRQRSFPPPARPHPPRRAVA